MAKINFLQMFGVGSIPWSPLARGLLTRPLTEQTTRGNTDLYVITEACSPMVVLTLIIAVSEDTLL